MMPKYFIEIPQRFSIFNIGSRSSNSVGELIEIIQDLAGTSLPIHSKGERRPHEVMDTIADIERASDLLGWQPQCSLRSGIAKVLQSYND